jgi:hypothetical protein
MLAHCQFSAAYWQFHCSVSRSSRNCPKNGFAVSNGVICVPVLRPLQLLAIWALALALLILYAVNTGSLIKCSWVFIWYYIFVMWPIFIGKDSAVGISTDYRLDGLGLEPRWGQEFFHLLLLPQTRLNRSWGHKARRWSYNSVVLNITRYDTEDRRNTCKVMYECLSTTGPWAGFPFRLFDENVIGVIICHLFHAW